MTSEDKTGPTTEEVVNGVFMKLENILPRLGGDKK
jgi:hypothetical protein